MPNKSIYKGKAWKTISKSYALSKNCICENCGRAVYIDGISNYIPKEHRLRYVVHHKEHLNSININDENIVYGIDNLELLCIECHNSIHMTHSTRQDVKFDEYGNLIKRDTRKIPPL